MGRVRIDDDVIIPAPVDEVYGHVSDASVRATWMTELTAVDAVPGPVRPGDRFDGTASMLLHDFIGRSEVTKAVPGSHLSEHVVIGARFSSDWTFEPTADGRTLLRHSIDIDFPAGPFGRLERWILRRRLGQMQRASLRRLAELVAASTPT